MESKPMTTSLFWPFAAGAAVALLVMNLQSQTSTTRILEIKCVNNDLFDDSKRCNQVADIQAGTIMDLTVNMTTHNVLVEVVESTDGWEKSFLLDHCAMVDRKNWTCVSQNEVNSLNSKSIWRREFGMLQGHFYRS